MDEEYYGYIYKTEILDGSGRYYIGQHKSLKFDPHYFGSGNIIKDYINKHGTNLLRCTILEWAKDPETLNALEEVYVNKDILKDPLCINLTVGGNSPSDIRSNMNEERLKEYYNKLSDSVSKAWKNPEIRERQTNAIREAAKRPDVVANRNKVLSSEEYKQKQSKAQKEKYKDENYKKRVSNSIKQHYIDHPEAGKKAGEKRRRLYKANPNILKQLSETLRNIWANMLNEDKKAFSDKIKQSMTDEVRKKISDGVKRSRENDPTILERISESSKKNWQDEEFRNKTIEAIQKAKTEEVNKKTSDSLNEYWSKQENKEKHCAKMKEVANRPEERMKRSNYMKEKYSDENERTKQSERLKGLLWYNNGIKEHKYREGSQPDNWVRGRCCKNLFIKKDI